VFIKDSGKVSALLLARIKEARITEEEEKNISYLQITQT
jgi:hypothetical protein